MDTSITNYPNGKEEPEEIVNCISRGDDMWYNCHYLRRKSEPTTNIGTRLVITAGFIPLKTRIENMIAAGLDLQAKREEMYPDSYEYDMTLLDEDYDSDPDEISILQAGQRAEEALQRRRLKPKSRYEDHLDNYYPQGANNGMGKKATKKNARKPSEDEALLDDIEQQT